MQLHLVMGGHECWVISGEAADAVLRAWEAQKPLLPPTDWRAPPPAGFADAQGMRRVAEEPWRPVRQKDPR